jgi:hypothetical protein
MTDYEVIWEYVENIKKEYEEDPFKYPIIVSRLIGKLHEILIELSTDHPEAYEIIKEKVKV